MLHGVVVSFGIRQGLGAVPNGWVCVRSQVDAGEGRSRLGNRMRSCLERTGNLKVVVLVRVEWSGRS